MIRVVMCSAVVFVLSTGRLLAADPTLAEVFTYARDNYVALFSGTPVSGRYQSYSYSHFPTTGNYLAVDDSGVVWMLGPATRNSLVSLGPVSNYAALIASWKTTSAASSNVTRYNGTYTGTIFGQRDEAGQPFAFIFTVANGVVTVSTPALGFTGVVTASGAFQASAVEVGPPKDCPGTLVLTGQLTLNAAGNASASGSFFSPGVTNFCGDATSTWSATR